MRKIAADQRAIIFCIVLHLFGVAARVIWIVRGMDVPLPLNLISLTIGIIAVVFVSRLAARIYSIGLAILLGILVLIPLVGLITLLVVNSKATKVLWANGIKVGFMGANSQQFRQAEII